MSPTDLSQATPSLSVRSLPPPVSGLCGAWREGAAWVRTLENGHFAVPCLSRPSLQVPWPALF